MSDLVPVRRALLSVSDKTGLADFATALHTEFGVQLISTGGTAKFLRDAGLPVVDVADVTGFPEMMDGRVKTLHPKIHGGLLALRDEPEHVAAMQKYGIEPIDLVCINLYPFAQTIAKPGVTFEEAIENIDIGGPSMIRSAAKNHHFVMVVTSPEQYEKALGDLRKHGGASCEKHRRKLAQAAFAHTGAYDSRIAGYLARFCGEAADSTSAGNPPPDVLPITLVKVQSLRYGENPHQPAALYVDSNSKSMGPNVARAKQLHGKELSYINLLDADSALGCVAEFTLPAACIVKHATPCGAAAAATIDEAFQRAYVCDPVAAFGGIVALNRTVALSTAKQIVEGQKFLEVIVAPAYEPDALALLQDRWKNLRILVPGAGDNNVVAPHDGASWSDPAKRFMTSHKIVGGYLLQGRDPIGLNESNWKVVSHRKPTEAELNDLRVAWLVCKHVKSNAIVIGRDQSAVGIGGGQVDRVNACRIAVAKAGERARGSVAASDAFFPFPDGPELLLSAGVTALIHPGGSVRDNETLALVDRLGAAMILTGQRHFKH